MQTRQMFFRLGFAALIAMGSAIPSAPAAAQSSWPPTPLELRVSFEPTAFSSLGKTHLLYELLVTNFGPRPSELRRVEILDERSGKPVAAFEGEQLNTMLQPVGNVAAVRQQLPPGGSAIVFVSLELEGAAPDRLRHRVFTADSNAEGAAVGTHHTKLRVLSPPVRGRDWMIADGPNNDEDNHHRRGILALNGVLANSRRFAIDWYQVKDGERYTGDALDRSAYYSYGQGVFAVADGRVVMAKDGQPENVPRHNGVFRTAVPITLDTLGGNTVLLDLGDGQFAWYFHLLPGSLKVKAGDRVKRGQVLAQIGASGDARGPHLHFELTNSTGLLTGEGLPYLIDAYRIANADRGTAPARRNELPMRNMVLDIAEAPKSEGR